MAQRFAFILLLTLAVIQCSTAANSNLRSTSTSNNNSISSSNTHRRHPTYYYNDASTTSLNYHEHDQQRRELGFVDVWYTLLNLLHVPCPHHDAAQDHPQGHCAHHSHHPSSHQSGGGSNHGSSSGSSGGGGGGDDDAPDNDSDDNDGDDTTADPPCDDDGYNGNGCATQTTYWQNDGHTNDADDDASTGISYTDDATTTANGYNAGNDDAEYGFTNGWFSNFDQTDTTIASSISGGVEYGGVDSNKGMIGWVVAASLVAGVAGAAAFLVLKKRKKNDEASVQKDDEESNNIPANVYVQRDADQGQEMTLKVTPTTTTQPRKLNSIKSIALGRKSSFSRNKSSIALSIKSKFSRKSSSKRESTDVVGGSTLQHPVLESTTWEEPTFEDDASIASTNDVECGDGNNGYVLQE